MAQRVKTIEVAFDPRTTTLATNTTLATATRHDFAAKTIYMPETSGSRTIRSVELILFGYIAGTTTATSVDGCRLGIKLGSVAFDDLDLTGTGIANTGDPYSFYFTRDVTNYFVTNFGTGASQTCQVGVAIETAAADLVNNLSAKLRITYEYDDTNSTFVKTVRIPLEGNTGFLGTTANADQRGSSGAAQIPDLSTYLPETNKVFRQVFLEIYATDGGAATTDFTASFSIDAGTTFTSGLIEAVLNGSTEFRFIYDITSQNGFETNAVNDFEAWSSLASRFERMYAVLYVTYEYDASSSSIFNSLLVALPYERRILGNTTSTDQDCIDIELFIEEPTTITIKQSAILLFWENGGAGNIVPLVVGSGVASGTQGTTTSTYTGTAYVGAGTHSLCHRIDLAHGGSAITLARGRNVLTLKVYGATADAISCLSGFYIINYTSGKATAGEGAHNHTTFWMLHGNMAGAIAGDTAREVATTNQRTPNLPNNYFLQCVAYEIKANKSSGGVPFDLSLERLSGEWNADGWDHLASSYVTDAEYSIMERIFCANRFYNRFPSDPRAGLDIETNRKLRWTSGAVMIWGVTRWITHHEITFAIAGDISGSGGGTVNIKAHRTDNGELIASTSRSGNGAYSMTWYDNTIDVKVEAWEDATHAGRSDNDPAT